MKFSIANKYVSQSQPVKLEETWGVLSVTTFWSFLREFSPESTMKSG
jgi:hypothetical protein